MREPGVDMVSPHSIGTRRLRPLRTGVIDVERVNAGAGADEEAVLLRTAKSQVCSGLRQVDLPNEVTVRGIAANAVLAGISPAVGAPYIASAVRTHSIGDPRLEFGEDLAAAQSAAIDLKDAHVGGTAEGQPAVDHVQT